MPPTQGGGRQAPLPWATFRGPLQGQKPAGASAIPENPPCSAEYMGHAQPSPRRGALSRTYETRSRFSPRSCQSLVSAWVEAVLADARATELSLGLVR